MSDQADGQHDSKFDPIARAIRTAIADGDSSALFDWLDPFVTWGDCAGPAAVVKFLSAPAAAGLVATDLTLEVVADRIVAGFTLGSEAISQAIFVRDGRISEIIDASDRAHAISVRPVGDLAEAAERAWSLNSVSPVMPVADLAAAVDRYRSLGFDVRRYEGAAAYAFARRGKVELHLTQVADLDPRSNGGAVYLYVDDADAVYATWRLAGVDGRLTPPVDTEYGLREGAYTDPDGNLLRFGS